jgi:membrane fusion protein, copper/silver efflux system
MSRWLALVVLAALGGSVRAAEEPPDASRAPIRLDPAQQQALGLTWGTVERRPVEKVIRTVGRVDFDERRLALVTLKVGGFIETLHANYTGQTLRKGDPLFTLYSPELLTAQREYLLARETERRLRGSTLDEARASAAALVRASRERLRLWDLSPQQMRALDESGQAKHDLTIASPIAGVVIEKTVVAGQRVEPGAVLYRIADLSTVWVWGDVHEPDLPLVRVGQEAMLTFTADPGQRFAAHVAWVAPVLDAKTRTAQIRFELPNASDSPLRPGMYGNLELHAPLGERLVVPASAVLDSGRRQIVFADGGDGRLVPREVHVGVRFEDAVEVLDGVAAGERVVTSANFLIDSESRLRAAESMIGMMGSLGMGGVDMGGARPMEMAGGEAAAGEEKRVGDLRIVVAPARGSATVGENAIRVRIADTTGAPVKGAAVRFSYTMDMPGMTIEETPAREVEDGAYEGAARFTMGGPWSLVVQVERPGKPPVREKFTLRVQS